MWRLATIVLFLLAARSGTGQVTYNGQVRAEDGTVVVGANITAGHPVDKVILAFTVTDADGKYALNLRSTLDSVLISVSHLGFTGQSLLLGNTSMQQDFVLATSEIVLPELVVRQKPVVRKGDTLVFDVRQFRTAEDESIEDMLRHLPGITVERNGRILYQGLPINKFYVEGLDLLEGRYAQITRNLSLDAIRDVEILERHQAIRALDSIVRPPNAAINLRLKTNIALTGNGEAGAGFSPALYRAKGNLFGFQPNQQFSVQGAADNTGVADGAPTLDLYGVQEEARPLLQYTQVPEPILFTSSGLLRKREFRVLPNLLRRTGRYGQLKVQAGWNDLQTENGGALLATYRDAFASTTFRTSVDATEKTGGANGKLTYVFNHPRRYVRSELSGVTARLNVDGRHVINALPSEEVFRNNDWSAAGSTTAIFSKNKKAFQLRSTYGYAVQNYDVRSLPTVLQPPQAPSDTLAMGRQTGRTSAFSADTYTNLSLRRSAALITFRTGIRTELRGLRSELSRSERGQTAYLPLGGAFRNDTRHASWAPYLTTVLTIDRPAYSASVDLPVSYNILRRTGTDEGNALVLSDRLVSVAPEVRYVINFSNGRKLTNMLSYGLNYEDEAFFYNNFILVSDRFLRRSVLPLNRVSGLKYSLGYSVFDALRDVQFSTVLTYENVGESQLKSTTFNENGLSAIVLRQMARQQRLSLRNEVSFRLGTAVEGQARGTYRYSRNPFILNDRRLRLSSHTASLSGRLSTIVGEAVISWRPLLSGFRSNFGGGTVVQQRHAFTFFYLFPNNLGKFNYTLEWSRGGNAELSVSNILMSAWYKTRIGAIKTDLAIRAENLTDVDNFETLYPGIYVDRRELFRLPSRRLLLVLSREF